MSDLMSPATWSLTSAILALCCLGGAAISWIMAAVNRFSAVPEWMYGLWWDLRRAALGLAALVAAGAMVGSLYFSEHVGFVPCKLCWYQRICMYPLVLILGIAAVRRDRSIYMYVVPLASIGAVVSTYHSWIQAYPPTAGTSFCTVDAPCTERYIWEFGFVSLPLMALCGFVFIITMVIMARSLGRDMAAEADSEIDLGAGAGTDRV